MSTSELAFWRKCNACRKEIGFGTTYYVCSVSTCNRPRTGLVFCSASCWDSHLGEARHRDAWATDGRSPTREQWQRELATQEADVKSGPTPRPASGPVVRAGQQPSVSRADATQPMRPQSFASGRTSDDHDDTASPRRPPATPDSVQPQHARPTPAPAGPAMATPAPVRRVVVGDASPVTAAAAEGLQLAEVADRDIMIVVSKLKKYIKDRSGFHCSDAVADVLSEHVRALCDDSIRAAGRDDRKTVLDRDVPRPRR